MSMTVMQLEQAIERAEREGRQADVDKLRFLLGEVTGDGVTNTTPGEAYTVQDGDDVFGISEMLLGSIEYVPDLLKANPDTHFATGDEIVVPEVGDGEATAAASDAAALVELFETKGPPNDSWTAEDYALLEAVQAQTPAPVGGSGGGGANGGNGNGGSEIIPPGGENQIKEEEPRYEADVRIPSGGADFELPAEDAEIIAQFMAQMIMNGVVPDGSAWGPESGEGAERRERNRNQQGEDDDGDAKKYLDIWYDTAVADARLSGEGIDLLRQRYEGYLAAINNGELGIDVVMRLLFPSPVEQEDTPEEFGGTMGLGAATEMEQIQQQLNELLSDDQISTLMHIDLSLFMQQAEATRLMVSNETSGADRILPVQAFADLLDFGWHLADGNVDQFMWMATQVILGADPHENPNVFLTGLAGVEFTFQDELVRPFDQYNVSGNPNFVSLLLPYNQGLDVNSSGLGDWKPEFFDGTANQAFHFWNTTATTFYNSAAIAKLGDWVHDPVFLEPETLRSLQEKFEPVRALTGSGVSQEDANLSDMGIQLGSLLREISLSETSLPRDWTPGNWVLENLATNPEG